MTTQAKLGYGTKLAIDGNYIGEIISITPPNVSVDSIDVTTMDSTDSYRDFIPGLIDGGEVGFECKFYPGDEDGQIAVKNAIDAKTINTYVIEFPSPVGATWTFSAFPTAFEGDIPLDDAIGLSVSLKITGKPVLAISQSTGLTAPFFTISNDAIITPDPAGDVYTYVATVATGVTSVTVTPTATAGVITVNGNVVSTGIASSAIPLGAAGSVTEIKIVVAETNKTPKTYTIYLSRA